jgi:hypothetical protein
MTPLFRGLSISVMVGMLSSVLVCSDALGEEAAPREARSMARGLYLGAFGGGGVSDNDDLAQRGTAFSSGGPISVNAVGNANADTATIGGLHVGYEWPEWRLGKEGSGWGLLPAAELEGYYLGSTQSGQLTSNDTINRRFNVSLPMDMGVFLTNAVLNFHTPYKVHPYIGGGAGAAFVSISGADSLQVNTPEPGINHFNSNPNASSWSFAAQAKTGFRAEIDERWSLFAEYRFLYIAPTEYTFGATEYSTHIPTTQWNVHFGGMFYNIAVAGLGYSFGR